MGCLTAHSEVLPSIYKAVRVYTEASWASGPGVVRKQTEQTSKLQSFAVGLQIPTLLKCLPELYTMADFDQDRQATQTLSTTSC